MAHVAIAANVSPPATTGHRKTEHTKGGLYRVLQVPSVASYS